MALAYIRISTDPLATKEVQTENMKQPMIGRLQDQLSELSPAVLRYITRAYELCQPSDVHLCNGSDDENQALLDLLEENGTVRKLNQKLRPGCYAANSDPADVARSMQDTFICSRTKADAGPTNNWKEPETMRAELETSFSNCMEGRTMYIVPFCMGPVDSPAAKFCIQITDSPYVVVSLRITARMGEEALRHIIDGAPFIQCFHSVGCPIHERNTGTPAYKKARSSWPCNISKRRIVHFPETREVWSFGSGYGGNALLGKKCVALRIASVQGRDEGWLAEHMLILGITNPQGVKRYICAAFPSACGKTNLAMLTPSIPGWKVETIGDDIAWLRIDENGKMRAINPENGFFGVAPGTSMETNANAMHTFARNSLFTNVGVTDDGDIYWEGMDKLPECGITDWKGNKGWTPTRKANGKIDTKANPAAHPNSRFTAPLSQCPIVDDLWNSPEGVPIDAIIFGARRDDTQPLVYQSFDWNHGTFIGAAMRSNATKAAEQKGLVHDPMANLPFIGCNIKDYFENWLSMTGKTTAEKLPKIFHVNWFGKNDEGDFIWPGFSENIRVLQWILDRCDGAVGCRETPIGMVPERGGINLDGIDSIDADTVEELLTINKDLWEKEAAAIREFFELKLMEGDSRRMPQKIMDQLNYLEERLRH